MNRSRTLRSLVPAAALALLAVALLAPAANAASVPPLATSAQYEALVKFVGKLEGLSGTPASAAQKAAFDSQLENKHEAAVNKSTALFNRGKKLVQAESQRAFQAGVSTIRQTEAGELAALRRDYDARMNQVASNYEHAVGRLQDVYDNRAAAQRKEIRGLRKQKANAEGILRKALIQEEIERRLKAVADDRKVEQEELADLKAGYRREKDAVRSAKASASRVVQQNDDEAIVTLRNRTRMINNARVRTLQSRRVNQVRDLETKLNAGRAAIARMPAGS